MKGGRESEAMNPIFPEDNQGNKDNFALPLRARPIDLYA